MAEGLLGEAEVAALVAAAREGTLPAAPEVRQGRRRRVRDIDFSRPTKFTQDQERRLGRAHEGFCRMASARLSAELRLAIELELIGMDQLTWSTAVAEIPEPSIFAIVETEPLATRVLMSAELPLVVRLIDRLLGGPGVGKPRPTGLTEIELALTRRIFSTLLEQLSPTWDEALDLRLSVLEVETKAMNVNLAPPSEPTLRLTIEAKLERYSSTLALTIPYRSIEPRVTSLGGALFGEAAPDPLAALAVRAALATVDVELRAEAASTELDLEEVLALRPGSVVSLGAPAGATLYVDSIPLYRVRPGRTGARRAVEVLERLEGAS